jgi:hypothetical protein
LGPGLVEVDVQFPLHGPEVHGPLDDVVVVGDSRGFDRVPEDGAVADFANFGQELKKEFRLKKGHHLIPNRDKLECFVTVKSLLSSLIFSGKAGANPSGVPYIIKDNSSRF